MFITSPPGHQVLDPGFFTHAGISPRRLVGAVLQRFEDRGLTIVDDGQGHDIIYSANDGGLYVGVENDKKWQWKDVSGYGMGIGPAGGEGGEVAVDVADQRRSDDHR